MYKEIFIIMKIVNLQMRKNESTRGKVLKQLNIVNLLNFCVSALFPYTQNWN